MIWDIRTGQQRLGALCGPLLRTSCQVSLTTKYQYGIAGEVASFSRRVLGVALGVVLNLIIFIERILRQLKSDDDDGEGEGE